MAKANNAPMTDIGRMLTDEATRRGWSHDQAGEAIGVSQATFSRWCTGDNLPTYRHWTKMARFLRIPRDDVAKVIAAQRAARGPRGQMERIDDLEREVRELRALMEMVADQVGVQR